MPHFLRRTLMMGLTSAVTATVALGTGFTPAAADVGWYDAHTPLAPSSKYVLSLDPTGTRVLAAQWLSRHCHGVLRVTEYHHGRWHRARTVLRDTSTARCGRIPDIGQIMQSARGRTVVVSSTRSNRNEYGDYTYLVAVRRQGAWSPARILEDSIDTPVAPVAVARNGSVALTVTHPPLPEAAPFSAFEWRKGRWTQGHPLQGSCGGSPVWCPTGRLVTVSPHGGTRWVAYGNLPAGSIQLAANDGDGWTQDAVTPEASGSWSPMTATIDSGGVGSILAANNTGRFGDSGRLASITCSSDCGAPRFIPGASGAFGASWVAGDGRAARWAGYRRTGSRITAVTLWSWRQGTPPRAERTVTGFLSREDAQGDYAFAPDGSSVAAAWREPDAIVVTTREGSGRWHDATLRQCRRFDRTSRYRHQIAAAGSAAILTVQCKGERRTYFHGLK